jgi:hypothetical protein
VEVPGDCTEAPAPVIPPYEKFGDEGHLYIVKPLQEPGECLFKVGSTTQLLKRMYLGQIYYFQFTFQRN